MKTAPQSKTLTIEQAIALAEKATKQGNTVVAIEIFTAILQRQPNNAFAKKMVRTLKNSTPPKAGETDDPPQEKLAELGKLVQAGEYTKAEESSRQLLETNPKSSLLYNLLREGYPPTYSIWFHTGLLHTILHERLGIFEAHDDKLE